MISEKTTNLKVGLFKKYFSCLIWQRLKKDDLATDFIFGMREDEETVFLEFSVSR